MDSVKSLEILGTGVSTENLNGTLGLIESWIGGDKGRYICVADANSILRAHTDESHGRAMNGADMVTPDGMPLVWAGRLKGYAQIERVCGPDLMLELCAYSVSRGWRHYIFGGADGVPAMLSSILTHKFSGLRICGAYSPPFRPLTSHEDEEIIDGILEAKPDIIWVGLGCPKQEKWMSEHAHRLPGIVMIGVGAAFDFHTGRVKRAPKWMQRNGLEWLHRLISEPRRLWRRYLISAPHFAILEIAEILRYRFSKA